MPRRRTRSQSRSRSRSRSRPRSGSRSQSRQKGVLKIHLRAKQVLKDINHRYYSDPKVTIFAPNWVRQGLKTLRRYVKPGTVFHLIDENISTKDIVLKKQIGLKELEMIARNERSNSGGKIDFKLYQEVITEQSVIYAFKDLARQCIIAGFDQTTHIGGYKTAKKKQVKKVIIVDLCGLQFQKYHNTGRLVLVGNEIPNGVLDDLIYRKVVGQKKPTMNHAKSDRTGRFVKKGSVYFDTYAYERFVQKDFLLVCKALHQLPGLKVANVNLKFLKYGTGAFAGHFRKILEKHITKGIYRGLERQLKTKNNRIKSFEFPFYHHDQQLFDLCDKHRVYCGFTHEDALKSADYPNITVTTNHGDPHAMLGNAMLSRSVDGAIAENLRSKGNKFSPVINTKMKEKFIKM